MDEAEAQQASRDLVFVAALSILFWGCMAFFFFAILPPSRCRGELCGLGLVDPIIVFVGIAVLASAVAGAMALRIAVLDKDWFSVCWLAFFLAAAVFAAYVLFQGGRPGHPLVAAVYGFPLDGFGLHRLAYYGSGALVPVIRLLVLAFALTRGTARRVSAAVGSLAVLAFWVAIRIAG